MPNFNACTSCMGLVAQMWGFLNFSSSRNANFGRTIEKMSMRMTIVAQRNGELSTVCPVCVSDAWDASHVSHPNCIPGMYRMRSVPVASTLMMLRVPIRKCFGLRSLRIALLSLMSSGRCSR